MLLKFLFGHARLIPAGAEDVLENIKLKNILVFTRKTDIFQHSDMRSMVMMSATTGGFIRKFHKPEKAELFGESISCRVQTDGSMNPIYTKLISGGSWWKHEFHQHKRTITIFAIVEEGMKPSSYVSELEWAPVTHAEMVDIVKAEDEAANGW